jgi:hypothetical protein
MWQLPLPALALLMYQFLLGSIHHATLLWLNCSAAITVFVGNAGRL